MNSDEHTFLIEQDTQVCDIFAYHEKRNRDMHCTGLVKIKEGMKPELLPAECAEWRPDELLPIQEEGHEI